MMMIIYFLESTIILLYGIKYIRLIINIFPMVVIDENPFYYAAAGGIILGIATSINYMLRGKVTGMSGMVYGIVSLQKCKP